jgi:hypothetical protein
MIADKSSRGDNLRNTAGGLVHVSYTTPAIYYLLGFTITSKTIAPYDGSAQPFETGNFSLANAKE